MSKITPLRILYALLLLAGMSFLEGCSQTSVNKTWTAPDVGSLKFTKLFVLVLAEDDFNRRLAESALSEQFTTIPTVFATSVLPDITDTKKKAKVLEAIKSAQADGIIVMRLAHSDKAFSYGPNMARPMEYETFSGYYDKVYDVSAYYAQDRRSINAETTYGVETNIYDGRTEKLVWSGQTQSKRDMTNDRDVRGLATEVALTIRKTLKSQNLIP